jgi:hypothetical protein
MKTPWLSVLELCRCLNIAPPPQPQSMNQDYEYDALEGPATDDQGKQADQGDDSHDERHDSMMRILHSRKKAVKRQSISHEVPTFAIVSCCKAECFKKVQHGDVAELRRQARERCVNQADRRAFFASIVNRCVPMRVLTFCA